jgi:hypothetical protein
MKKTIKIMNRGDPENAEKNLILFLSAFSASPRFSPNLDAVYVDKDSTTSGSGNGSFASRCIWYIA